MYIYTVIRTDGVDCDEYAGFVIAATTPTRALKAADDASKYFNISNTVIENVGLYSGEATETTILFSDFRAG